MLKRLCALIGVALTLIFSLGSLPKTSIICIGEKSAGTFKELNQATKIELLQRCGVSFSASEIEALKIIESANATLVYKSNVNGVENYYYYSPYINGKELVKGKKVNLHVAVSNEKVTVGSPLIYYGY